MNWPGLSCILTKPSTLLGRAGDGHYSAQMGRAGNSHPEMWAVSSLVSTVMLQSLRSGAPGRRQTSDCPLGTGYDKPAMQ